MDFMKLKDRDEAEETYQVIIQEIQPRKPYPLKEGVGSKREQLKNLLRGFRSMDAKTRRGLAEMGFAIASPTRRSLHGLPSP